MISAHRGGTEAFPAEAYEAFAHAAASGADFVEFDVHRVGDGTLVCRHPRPDDAEPWPMRTYGELCERVGYEVPLMSRVMAIVAGRARCHIDLKETGYETDVVALAVDALGPTGFVVTTMVDTSLRRIAKAFPDVTTFLSLGRGPRDVPARALPAAIAGDLFPIRRVRQCGAAGVAVNWRLAPWVLGRCTRYGLDTMVWTVDGTGLMDKFLADPRVDVVITNRPLLALERRARHAAR